MQSLAPAKRDPWYRNHQLRDAIGKAIYDQMAIDPSIYLFGEGAWVKQHYDAPQIWTNFPERVVTTPIAEDGGVNFCVGASLLGIKPVFDLITADFSFRAFDSIANTAAKLNFVRPDELPRTIVIRAEFLTGGPSTGQRPEALFAHIPGLNIVIPSTPADAYGLMLTALKTPGVTLFFEDREISDAIISKQEDLVLAGPVPIGCPLWRMKGQRGNVTVVTYGVMRQRVEELLKKIQMPVGRDYYAPEAALLVDLIDLRTIYPIDYSYLKFMLGSTGKLLILESDITYGGVGAEIVAQISEDLPGTRVKRLGCKRETIPAASRLHQHLFPSDEEIIHAITDWS